MLKDTLMVADTPNENGIQFTHKCLQHMVKHATERLEHPGIWATQDFEDDWRQLQGILCSIKLQDNKVKVEVEVYDTPVGKLVKKLLNPRIAYGGVIVEHHREGKIRVIDKFELHQISVVLTKE